MISGSSRGCRPSSAAKTFQVQLVLQVLDGVQVRALCRQDRGPCRPSPVLVPSSSCLEPSVTSYFLNVTRRRRCFSFLEMWSQFCVTPRCMMSGLKLYLTLAPPHTLDFHGSHHKNEDTLLFSLSSRPASSSVIPLSPSVVVLNKQQGVVGRGLRSRWVCE